MYFEKRKQERISQNPEVDASFTLSSSHALSQVSDSDCKAVDASMHGVCLKSKVDVPRDATIRVKVHLAKSHNGYKDVRLMGKVKWVKPIDDPKADFLIGVELSRQYSTDAEAWKGYVRKRKPTVF